MAELMMREHIDNLLSLGRISLESDVIATKGNSIDVSTRS